MAIAFDAISSFIKNSGSSPETYSHTVASGSDRLLVVIVATSSTYDGSTSVTYNGVAMTQTHTVKNGTGFKDGVFIFTLVAPATGTNTVSITKGHPNANCTSCAISFTGVDQTTPIGATDGVVQDATGGSSISNNITTTYAATWILDALGRSTDNTTPSADAGQVERGLAPDGPGPIVGVSTKSLTTAETTSTGWSYGVVGSTSQVLAQIALVDVEQPSAATDNAIFFGTNF